MADLTLKLLATSYDQPTKGDGDPTPRSEGEVFDANDKAEYERLIEIGAALDPKAAAEAESQRLEAERAQLEARKAELDAQLDQLQDPSELKGKALDDALTAAKLSTEGTADEKRARLAEHQQAST